MEQSKHIERYKKKSGHFQRDGSNRATFANEASPFLLIDCQHLKLGPPGFGGERCPILV